MRWCRSSGSTSMSMPTMRALAEMLRLMMRSRWCFRVAMGSLPFCRGCSIYIEARETALSNDPCAAFACCRNCRHSNNEAVSESELLIFSVAESVGRLLSCASKLAPLSEVSSLSAAGNSDSGVAERTASVSSKADAAPPRGVWLRFLQYNRPLRRHLLDESQQSIFYSFSYFFGFS